MGNPVISHSQLTRWNSECIERFGKIHQLQIVRSCYEECRRLYRGGKVLDVGAGTSKQLKKIMGLADNAYFSLDTDPDGDFDYASFDEIPPEDRFELIVLNQVVEHLTINEAVLLMQGVAGRLTDNGYCLISVPNVQHPVRYWGDPTHVTPWPYEHLYGLLKHCGLEVRNVARFNKSLFPRNPIKRYIVRTVCDMFRMDWCDTILLTAAKKCY